jgi:hypothetical protein
MNLRWISRYLPHVRGTSWQGNPAPVGPAGLRKARSAWVDERAVGIMASLARKATGLSIGRGRGATVGLAPMPASDV